MPSAFISVLPIGKQGLSPDRPCSEESLWTHEFCMVRYGASSELMDNLLRYDALMADGGRIRPDALDWNLEKYQSVTADFGVPLVYRNICRAFLYQLAGYPAQIPY